jgi:hypothetical protein
MTIPSWLQNQNNALLVSALLLALWLWLLVSKREEEQRQMPKRQMPLTSDELGRMVFMAALSQNLRSYRSLFLNAFEAKEKLGDYSEQYLEKRDLSFLQRTFSELESQIPKGTIYIGVDKSKTTLLSIVVRKEDLEVSIPIGSISKVGLAIRLLEPA